jgi:hypothetical protein
MATDMLIAFYGLDKGGGTQSKMALRNAGLSDRQVTHALIPVTDDEQQFLDLHAKILKMSTTDRMIDRGNMLIALYKKMSLGLVILFWVVLVVSVGVMFPIIVSMILGLFKPPYMAIAKLSVMAMFAIGFIITRLVIGD